jgi:lipopolysaccharide/colanic/teichoic acid biosynthesis glycosyltransferase
MYKHFFKRLFDFVISLIALPFVLILCLFVWIAIKLDDGGPLFHMASRIGKNGRIFKMFKFRSMIVNAPDLRMEDGSTYNAEDDPRVTKVGKFLRKTSLDEIPQLLNVLIGDMALIGPRPALTYHPWPYEQYDEHQKHMFDVRPGITGWAQVNGRKEVPWPERIELNIYYVEHLSFALDWKIFWMTIFKVATNADNENVGETGVKK